MMPLPLSQFPLDGVLLALLPIVLTIVGCLLWVFPSLSEKKINLLLLLLGLLVFNVSGYLIVRHAGVPQHYSFTWFDLGKPQVISFGLDHLGILLFGLVLFVTALVIWYSTGYLHKEPGVGRYFGSLLFFASAMIGIVYSFNILMTFVFWELVGFSSYLLINFWYRKPASNYASKKAFLLNRIGDLGFVMALGLSYSEFGTFELSSIFQAIQDGKADHLNVVLIGFGIFWGCIGKSAQFPLFVWLPDAMQAPTPVSALLHAATMVAAGIFLIARLMPIFAPEVLTFMAYTGAITSVIGAYTAATQTDLKKILAYSTISQLGYMVAGLGARAYFAAVFHLMTHALFKASLFLCAGAVLHEISGVKYGYQSSSSGESVDFDVQDIRFMGGLRKRMPFTFLAFLLASLAGAGVPLSAGFLSKDELLASLCAWAWAQDSIIHFLLPVLVFGASLMTAFYLGRLFFVVFFGGFRLGKFYPALKGYSQHVHDPGLSMVIPCLILSGLCVFVFFSFHPLDPDVSWLALYLPHPLSAFKSEVASYASIQFLQQQLHTWVIAVSMVVLSLGFLMAYLLYGYKTKFKREFIKPRLRHGLWASISRNGFYLNQLYDYSFVKPFERICKSVDEFDRKWIDEAVDHLGYVTVGMSHVLAWLDKYIVDGLVHLIAHALSFIAGQLRTFQNGKVQTYLMYAMIGLLTALCWILW